MVTPEKDPQHGYKLNDQTYTINLLVLAHGEVSSATPLAGSAVATMPARADAISNFELLLVLVHGDNISDNLVTRNLRETRTEALILDKNVTEERRAVNVTLCHMLTRCLTFHIHHKRAP